MTLVVLVVVCRFSTRTTYFAQGKKLTILEVHCCKRHEFSVCRLENLPSSSTQLPHPTLAWHWRPCGCAVLLNPKSYTQGYERIVRAQQQQKRQGKAKHWFVGQGILRIDKLPRLVSARQHLEYNFSPVFRTTVTAKFSTQTRGCNRPGGTGRRPAGTAASKSKHHFTAAVV